MQELGTAIMARHDEWTGAPNGKPPQQVRVFRAWLQEWDVKNMKVNDPKVKDKFFNKFALSWFALV